MTLNKKGALKNYIEAKDVIGAMTLLKNTFGVLEGFICNKANVNIATYSRYKKGDIKTLGADKREALINVIEEMYL